MRWIKCLVDIIKAYDIQSNQEKYQRIFESFIKKNNEEYEKFDRVVRDKMREFYIDFDNVLEKTLFFKEFIKETS